MENCKIYCLEDNSVIEVPYHYSLYGYISYAYFDHPDIDSHEAIDFITKTGTFMAVYENSTEFIVSYDNYSDYMIYSDSHGTSVKITDFETHDGEVDYVDIVSVTKMSSFMNCKGLSDEKRFTNMVTLKKYLQDFVDNIEDFANK